MLFVCKYILANTLRAIFSEVLDLERFRAGHSRSLILVPFDRPRMISYQSAFINCNHVSVLYSLQDTVTYLLKFKEVAW